MKKLFFLAAFVLAAQISFGQAAAAAGTTKPASDYAVAVIDEMSHDFGKIKQGVPVTHEFTFVNKGKVPMIITNAQPSCGCTIPLSTFAVTVTDLSKRPGEAALNVAFTEPCPPGGIGSLVQAGMVHPHEG